MKQGLIAVFYSMSLVACGGGNFSSPGTHSDAGSGTIIAGAGGSSAGASGHAGYGAGGATAGSGSTGGSSGSGTSEAGAPNDPAVWSGKTYFLSVPAKSWTSPPNIGTNIGGIAPNLLLSISGDGDSLTTLISTSPASIVDGSGKSTLVSADDAEQDMCTPTMYAALDASNYPQSEIGPLDIRAHLVSGSDAAATQVTATLYGLHLTNVLPGDDQVTGTLEATIDMREAYLLFPALGPTRTADSVCKSFRDNFTSSDCSTTECTHSCEPCPADGKPYCLSLKAENVSAEVVPVAMIEIKGSDRAKSCADSHP